MNTSSNYIITAANDKYFKNLKQLIFSYKRSKEYKNSRLVIFDLGLTSQQIKALKKLETTSNQRINYYRFDFDSYPEFVKPEYNHYSWKPILISLISDKLKGNFLWMDSANCILKELTPIWKQIVETGTYAPISGSGTLKEWTVQATLDYLEVPNHYYSKRNRAGNTFGFTNNSPVLDELVQKWEELALIPECIRPAGANRSNHRDDQSLLTILLLEQEEKGLLILTNEEVNISSPNPTKYLSVRNLFPKWVYLPVGIVAHYYFLIQRRVDIIINKLATS